MTKKEVAHLLKRYRNIMQAIDKGENCVKIEKSGRKEIILIDEIILKFTDILKKVYESETSHLSKKFIDINIIQGNKNLSTYASYPLYRSTYYRYKKEFVDKVYHCCIFEGLVDYQEILNEKIIVQIKSFLLKTM